MKVFLSYSFADKDAEVAKHFADLLSTTYSNVQIITARDPKAIPIAKKVEDAINQCDCVLAILTRKVELKNGKWAPPPWCISEIGIAVGRRIPWCAFREKDVELDSTGMTAAKVEIPLFNRKALPLTSAAKYIRSAFGDSIFPQGNYQFECYDSHTVILANGHGICESRIQIHALDKVDVMSHMIGVAGGPVRASFPKGGLNALVRSDFRQRFNMPSLYARILSSDNKKRKIAIEPCPSETATAKRIHFQLRFTPGLDPDERLNYGYCWSLPHMHYTSDAERRKDKGENPKSIWTATHPACRFVKRMSFEHGINIGTPPHMVITDCNGKEISAQKFEHQVDLCYQRYQIVVDPVARNSKHTVAWKVK